MPHKTKERHLKVIIHYWGYRGGGSKLAMLLTQKLKSAHRPVEIILSLAEQNADIEMFRKTGVPITTIDRPNLSTLWRKAWSLPFKLEKHANTLASFKPDAVVITMNSPFAWPFIRALKNRGIKVLYVVHDAEPHPGDYARLWQRLTQDQLIRGADRVVALSRSVAERLRDRIPASADKISVVPLENVYPTNRASLHDFQYAGSTLRFLFYGRLLPYKGLDLLAQALEPLKVYPNWQLTIAGSGPLAPNVRRAFAGLPQVNLELDWITEQRTVELFSSHHLLLCPYSEASQSGVIAEALSWAMPCAVMPTGALPEQIGFGAAGLIADTMDADGFRRSLQTILEQPSRLTELSRGAASLLQDRQNRDDWITLTEG